MASPFRQLYEFGPYRLDASERQLRRGAESVHLTPKEFDTLSALVRGAGRLMSKEELLKEIWPDTFVGEATLAQNVFTLRRALGEAEGGKSYIETVPRRGYRFAAPVREVTEGREAEGTTPARAAAGVEGGDSTGRTFDSAGRFELESAAPQSPKSPAGGGNGAGPAAETNVARDEAATPDAPEVDAREATPPSAVEPPAHPSSVETSAQSPHVAAAPPNEEELSSSFHVEEHGHPVRAAVVISVVAFVSVAALVYFVYRFSVKPEAESARGRAPAFQSMKVTRLPASGTVNEAVISPDGKYFAYVSSEPGRRSAGVWIRQVGAASNMQQLVAPAEETFYGGLSFSPDSLHVYYGAARPGTQPPTLSRVPVLGGPPEKILDNFQIQGPSSVTFSPDGRRMAFVRRGGEDAFSLVVADSAGRNERVLVTHERPVIFGLPSWSPDGSTIVCAYGSAERAETSTPYIGITSFDASTGAETRITNERWVNLSQLSWLPDSKGLVLSASEEELSPSQIWQLDFPSGEARRVTNDLNTYLGASLTADANALVTVQTDRVPNIWVAPAGDASRARQITTGSGKFDGYYGVAWTPDGRIVYASVAGGSWDIWTMNADGTGQRQLTVGARSNYGPSVSADGRRIVFVSNRAGAFNIWRMDADGSNPLQLTRGRGENFAHFTPDGRWVIYATIGYGQSNAVWKIPADGGEPVKLTEKPASWPFVSPDGKSFVCVYGNDPFSASKLAVIPVDGGGPTKMFDLPQTFNANTVWLPDNRGIAFLDSRTGTNNVWVQPLSGGKPVQLTDFASDGVAAYDWSRDNRLAATRSVESTGIVLIKNFR
ncbi:MAG TPA: winged helix-turn-helix domain-containing protein [Pyrinomonadaceae bacterium]|nr:winged helix-turn-helix domain-containing protein [Pyrinomonadaceae bacterium]